MADIISFQDLRSAKGLPPPNSERSDRDIRVGDFVELLDEELNSASLAMGCVTRTGLTLHVERLGGMGKRVVTPDLVRRIDRRARS